MFPLGSSPRGQWCEGLSKSRGHCRPAVRAITFSNEDAGKHWEHHYLVRAVSEEVNFLEFLVRDVPQAERLVPSIREDIEGDLAANREGKAVV